MVVKSWNRLKRNECMGAWMHGCMDAWMHDTCSHAIMHSSFMQSCNSPNTPPGISGRLTSYKLFIKVLRNFTFWVDFFLLKL
jgi:hypothetical protein